MQSILKRKLHLHTYRWKLLRQIQKTKPNPRIPKSTTLLPDTKSTIELTEIKFQIATAELFNSYVFLFVPKQIH